MTAFLLRYLPQILAALAILILGAITAHAFDGRRYQALQTDFANYRTETANAYAKAQAAARQAVEQQILERQAIEKHNAEVLQDYATAQANLTADRDHDRELVRRLLAAERAGSAASGGPVSAPGNQSGTAESGPPRSDGRLEGLLADAAAECRLNSEQLNALEAQIRPQL